MNKLIISFLTGTGGRFIASIVNYMMYDTTLDVLDENGAAHRNNAVAKKWWLTNTEFVRDYCAQFAHEIPGPPLTDHTTMFELNQLMLVHSTRYGSSSRTDIVAALSPYYNTGQTPTLTHCINPELLRAIANTHELTPIILLIEVNNESELAYRHQMSDTKNGPPQWSRSSRFMSLIDIQTAMQRPDDNIIRFSAKHLMNKNVDMMMTLFLQLAEALGLTLTHYQVSTIEQTVRRYFDAQPEFIIP